MTYKSSIEKGSETVSIQSREIRYDTGLDRLRPPAKERCPIPVPSLYCVHLDQAGLSSARRAADIFDGRLVDWRTMEDLKNTSELQVPSVVLSELLLPDGRITDLLKHVGRVSPHTPVIVLSSHADVRSTAAAMYRGAMMVLESNCSKMTLWRVVGAGLRRNQTRYRRYLQRVKLRESLAQLSPRESEVLELIVEGRPNKAIASRLNVSVRTIENLRRKIFAKTGTDSVAMLVRAAVGAGRVPSIEPVKQTARPPAKPPFPSGTIPKFG